MPDLASLGRLIAHNPLATAGVGAGAGALVNVGREALRDGDQPKNYLGAAIRGAATGGALGGAAGGIARASHDTMLLHPELGGMDIAKKTLARAGEGVSNFAHRQFHGLTGYGGQDQKYLDRIGIAGSGPAAQKAKLLNLRVENQLTHGDVKNIDKLHQGLHEHVKGLVQEGEIGDRFRELGMTSAPGAVKAMVTNPREASKAIWNQLRAGGKASVGLGVGLPVAMTASSIAKGDERATGGPSVQEKALRGATNIGGGLLFGGLPIAASNVVGGAADYAAHHLGRALAPKSMIADANAGIR